MRLLVYRVCCHSASSDQLNLNIVEGATVRSFLTKVLTPRTIGARLAYVFKSRVYVNLKGDTFIHVAFFMVPKFIRDRRCRLEIINSDSKPLDNLTIT